MALHPDKKRTVAEKAKDLTRHQERSLKRHSRLAWFQREVGSKQQYILAEIRT